MRAEPGVLGCKKPRPDGRLHFPLEAHRPSASEPTWTALVLGWGWRGEELEGITLPFFHPRDEPPADCSFRVFILLKHPRLFYLFIFYPPPSLLPSPPSQNEW